MRPLVTPDEMRRADEEAIAAGTPAHVLMDRAGYAVARAVLREATGRYDKKVTVVCGQGNNGGDGFAGARVLHREGLRVVCCTTFDPEDAKGPAKVHLDLLRQTGCPVVPFERRHLDCDVIVDAVFGTGFRGQAEGEAREALEAVARVVPDASETPPPRLISVDVPSAGMVPAHVTVALGAEKLQTFFRNGDRPMEVVVADIGIPVREARVFVVDDVDVYDSIPRVASGDHKTSHGVVVVMAGSDRTTGAALLVTRAAERMGAGYVTLASTPRVIDAANQALPEALKATVVQHEALGPGVLDELAAPLDRADAVALGPGLGTGISQTQLVERAVGELQHPLVLDADALNALVGRTEVLAGREWPLVLTPHAAEMARLLGVDIADVLHDRVATVIEAAERFGCTVILKGHNTLVAAPAGETAGSGGAATASVIPVGGPELATAGTGDVLTGAIAAVLARGGAPLDATVAACYVHGVAGAVAAERVGATGVLAWDVCEALPEAIRRLRSTYPDGYVTDEG